MIRDLVSIRLDDRQQNPGRRDGGPIDSLSGSRDAVGGTSVVEIESSRLEVGAVRRRRHLAPTAPAPQPHLGTRRIRTFSCLPRYVCTHVWQSHGDETVDYCRLRCTRVGSTEHRLRYITNLPNFICEFENLLLQWTVSSSWRTHRYVVGEVGRNAGGMQVVRGRTSMSFFLLAAAPSSSDGISNSLV